MLEQVGAGLAQEGTALIELSSRAFSITQKIRVVMDELARYGNPNADSAFRQTQAAKGDRAKNDDVAKRLALEGNLRRALRRREFALNLHGTPRPHWLAG